MKIRIDRILPNPEQPRTVFDQAELDRLADSIREHGLIHPIIVEEAENGYYILHDGERRWRAAKQIGMKEIVAHVTPPLNGSGKTDRLIRAMVANILRSDLNIVEEARAYQRMLDDFGYSVSKISRVIGISEQRVKNRLKILMLDESIQGHIASGNLPKDDRAIDALLSVEDRDLRVGLAERAAERRMSVKGISEACKRINQHLAEQKLSKSEVPAVWQAVRKNGKAVNKTNWDALAQVGKVPPWVLLESAARETCRACSWYEMANETICKDCPLPQAIAAMIRKVER